MSKESERLNEIAGFFRRTSGKIKLIKLIIKAKQEYDKYDYESSRQSLEEGLQLDPENPVILRGLGCIEQFGGNYDEAVSYYKKAVKFSTAKELEYTLIGTAYYLQDKLDEAVEYFNLAIDANDDYTVAYEGRNQAMLENHIRILDLQDSLKKYF